MKLAKFVAVSMVAIAGGCSSFNHYSYVNQPTKEETAKKVAEIEHKAAEIEKKNTCPKFKFSTLPPRPSPPIARLKTVGPNDSRAIEIIMMDYIEQLNTHDKKVKDIIAADRKRYETQCTEFQNKKRSQEITR